MDHTAGLEALKAAADQGRDEYWKNSDTQGFLSKEPKRDKVCTDRYELLLEAVYKYAASDTKYGISGPAAHFFEIVGFPDLAHQIRAGLKDAEKEAAPPQQSIDLTNEHVRLCAQHEWYWDSKLGGEKPACPDCEKEAPPSDDNVEPPFTEEEIARVLRFYNENDGTFMDRAHDYKCFAEEDAKAAERYRRLAACAQHLAQKEGEAAPAQQQGE